MSKRTVYYVNPHDEGWEVKKQGASRASNVTETKAEAVQRAVDLAHSVSGPSQVKIKTERGTIQSERTYIKDPRKYPG